MEKIFLALIFSAALFEAVADIFFKYWSINGKTLFLLGGFLIYSVSTIVWAFSLKYGYLSKAITVFTVLNLILVVLAGLILFKEDLSLINKIGILLGVVSIVLLQM